MKHSGLQGLLLAAGASTRLGQPKQLVIYQGLSLITRQTRLLLKRCQCVTIVLGANADLCRRTLEAELLDHELAAIELIENQDWATGLGSSIALGAAHFNRKYRGMLLLLVDQWQLTDQHIRYFIKHWHSCGHIKPSNICIASMQQEKFVTGPPVIFSEQFIDELSQFNASDGAKSLIKRYSKQVFDYPIPQAFTDLDTPEQLQMLRASES